MIIVLSLAIRILKNYVIISDVSFLRNWHKHIYSEKIKTNLLYPLYILWESEE